MVSHPPPERPNASPPPIPGEAVAPDAETTLPSEDLESYRDLPNRKSFGRYELLMEMGQGGMAGLYLARIRGPEKFEKLLAVKRIHDHLARQPEFTEMFLDEARLAARIHHPNVAAIFDMGVIDEIYFIAMEYVHGQNLTDILRAAARRRTALDWSCVARIVADAAAGLHAAHELQSSDGKPLGVVHRDVSPQNILVSYDGHVKVVDFGIAYAAERIVQTNAGTLKGKVPYMSPEQAIAEPLDRRSDIFSLGTVLFECVCLKRLFKEDSEAATLMRVREAKVPSPRAIQPGLPLELERIIFKALSKDPADRFATADDLAERLNACLVAEGKSTSATTISKLMDGFFHDRKKIKDGQIKQALEQQGNEPLKSVTMEGNTHTALELSGAGSMSAAARTLWSSPGIKVGAVLTAVVGVGLVVFFAARQAPSSAPARSSEPAAMQNTRADSASRVEPRPPARPTPKNVTLKFVVRPTTAEVVFRGKTYAGARFKAVIPPSAKMENVVVRAKGFVTQTLVVTPTENNTFTVSLLPAPAKVMRPRKRPTMRRRRRRRRGSGAGLLKTMLE